jgi:peptidoglycan hydrolase-like protein with peptidoglycan-binding domain
LRRLRLALPLAAALMLALASLTPARALSRAQFPIQSVGDRGTDVAALQHLLRARGQGTPVTGYFGADTRQALMAYQQSVGLSASGIANVATWQKIVPTLEQGNGGEAVLALKKQLNAKRNAGLALTSSFDAATRRAVRTLQSHMNLAVTGTVNVETWRNLMWHYDRPAFYLAGLCNYNGGHSNADWGTANTIASLEAAADLFRGRSGGEIAIGDLSFEHGGEISLHNTHEDGLDIDIALVRRDGRQCNRPGISYRHAQYDRAATRAMLQALHDAFGRHLQLIYFNDPQMIREGLSIRFPNHDDHIHVRVCEASHPKSRYVC